VLSLKYETVEFSETMDEMNDSKTEVLFVTVDFIHRPWRTEGMNENGKRTISVYKRPIE